MYTPYTLQRLGLRVVVERPYYWVSSAAWHSKAHASLRFHPQLKLGTFIAPAAGRSVSHGAEHFRDAPRLCDTAAGALRCVSIKDFGNLTETFLSDVAAQFRQPPGCLLPRFGRAAVYLEIRRYKRAHQPWPDRTLMIRAVAAVMVSFIPAAVVRVGRRQSPQSEWRQQIPLDDVHHFFGLIGGDHAVRQAHREDLVGPNRAVTVMAAHDIVKAAGGLVPEKVREA